MASVHGPHGLGLGDGLAVVVFSSPPFFTSDVFLSSRILIQFLLRYETVNSLRGGSAVITTVMSGGAEERSLGRRKATVQQWPPEINGELEMNQ